MTKIYFNLHKKCLSVMVDGIVVQHTTTAFLTNVTFQVSAAGRARVLKTRAKNVHAFIIGELGETSEWEYLDINAPIATYNPYKYASFILRHNESPIFRAAKVLVTGRAIYILEP